MSSSGEDSDVESCSSSSGISIIEHFIPLPENEPINKGEQDTFISYLFPLPTLQKIAMIRLVTSSWKMPELEHQIQKHHLYSESHFNDELSDKQFRELKENLVNRLEQLLPSKLSKEASNFIRPIGLQIFEWMSCINKLCPKFYPFSSISNFIQWTMIGTIDKRRTFECLLTTKNEQNLKELYKMACYYCLEDSVRALRVQLGNFTHKIRNHPLVTFWENFLTKKNPSDEVVTIEILKLSIQEGNSSAVKFLWPKLSDKVRCDNVVTCAKQILPWAKENITQWLERRNEFTEMLVFFLSEMNNGVQQRKIFEHNIYDIVELLYYSWPWNEFLLPTICAAWDFLHDTSYFYILGAIFNDMSKNGSPNDILKELWKATPMHFKKGLLDAAPFSCDRLLELCEREDVEMIRLIINDASDVEKKRLVLNAIDRGHVVKVFEDYTLPAFEMLLKELATHEKDFNSIKAQVIERHGDAICTRFIYSDQLEMTDKFLNWCLASQDEVDRYKKHVLNKTQIINDLTRFHHAHIEKIMQWFSEENTRLAADGNTGVELLEQNEVADKVSVSSPTQGSEKRDCNSVEEKSKESDAKRLKSAPDP